MKNISDLLATIKTIIIIIAIVILAKEGLINNKEGDKGTIIIKQEEDINREANNNNISSEKDLIKTDNLDNTIGKTLNNTMKDNTTSKHQVILTFP